MITVERRLQKAVDSTSRWVEEHSSDSHLPSRLPCTFFRLRSHHSDSDLIMGGSCLPVIEEHRFLVLFTCLPHLKALIRKCMRQLDLRVLLCTSWSADPTIPICLYQTLIRSRLPCCCEVRILICNNHPPPHTLCSPSGYIPSVNRWIQIISYIKHFS